MRPVLQLIDPDGDTFGFAMALPDVNQALKHANGRQT